MIYNGNMKPENTATNTATSTRSTRYEQNVLALIRAHFRALEGYVSAGMQEAKSAEKLFLNANENPFELPRLEGLNRYPPPQSAELTAAMAAFYGVSPEGITITRGADEGIAMLFRLFCEPHHDDILINPPTFGVYRVYGNAMPARRIIETPLTQTGGTFHLDCAAIETALNQPDQRIKLIFLTNPNNPTGTLFPRSDILEIIRMSAGKAIVVLDETYAEFAPECSLTADLDKDGFEHVIILRTLSKSFSLAGMRVGAILTGAAALTHILQTKVMEIYPIPTASIKAALHVLSSDIRAQALENIQTLITERKNMEAFLATLENVRAVYPSAVNFLLIEMARAAEFIQFAKAQNVIIRDFSAAPDTKDCIRLSIGTPEQNRIVMRLFEEFYSAS
ncbi:MAG: histidinol-phosphate transaminase [Alphaproteobacteria bacterium]